MRSISSYIAPLVMLTIGIAFLVVSFTKPSLKTGDFSEVRGHLQSYHISRDRDGRYPKTIVVLEEGDRFWTSALDEDDAAKALKMSGIEVKTYVLTQSTNVPIDNAVKSYGLWIGGREIQSIDSEIASEELLFRILMPTVAVLLVGLAIYVYLKSG